MYYLLPHISSPTSSPPSDLISSLKPHNLPLLPQHSISNFIPHALYLMPYPSALHPSSHLPNPFSLISSPSPLVQFPIFSPLLPQTSPPPSHPPSSRTLFIHPSNTPHFSPHTSYPPSHFRPIHSLLITHYSSLIPPPSSLMPHTSFPILHTHPLYLMTLPLIP